MKAPGRTAFRFAVGEPDGPQSTIWRLWIHGPDVYIAPRQVGHRWKISFHEGGRCHWGFESEDAGAEAAALGTASTGRFPDVWQLPQPFAAGWIRAFTIVVPMSELRQPLAERKTRDVLWIEPGPSESAISFVLLFGPPGATLPEQVPAVRDHPTTPLFGGVRGDDSVVWLSAYGEDLLPEAQARLIERTRAQLAQVKDHPKVKRMIDPQSFAFGFANDDGSRIYIEIGRIAG
jgi:hypothetical protein